MPDSSSTPIASWIREVDDTFFADLASARRAHFENARNGPVDLDEASALLLTGGADLSEEFHREAPSDPALIHDPDPARDAWEFTALRRALDLELPILGICKGIQVLNVALGGTLRLDIPGHNLPELKSANLQELRYSSAARHRFVKVNSSHHQALDRVADALEIEAWCREDEIVEQVRIRNYPWAIGVQYHPERDAVYYGSLFDDFIGAAISRQNGTAE